MRRLPAVGITVRRQQPFVGTLNERSEPLLPWDLLFRLGLLMLIALCCGLVAKLLVGAPT